MPYDLPPLATRPTTVDGSEIYRGASLDFELSAIANDAVDDTSTMTAEFEYSRSGEMIGHQSGQIGLVRWALEAISNSSIPLLTPLDAPVGDYDSRVKWTDARGQSSEWLVTDSAFMLRNAIPKGDIPNGSTTRRHTRCEGRGSETISLEGLVGRRNSDWKLSN